LSRDEDRSATFIALLQPIQRQLEVYCRRMLNQRSDVEDVLQTAVMTAFAQFDRYAEGTNFRAWMFRFVTHEVFNRNRKRDLDCWGEFLAEVAVLPEEFPVPEDLVGLLIERPDAVMELLDEFVVDALTALPPAERTVLLLRAVGEFTYREMHEILSIPVNSVMGYLSRARMKLRQSLADYAVARGLPVRPVPGETRS
jgi:RNA polymerase sigma-70 factor (ECF subfamily)